MYVLRSWEDGQPIKKGWTIAGNFKELSKLDSFTCDVSHKHGQSRGKALKLAEIYTFRLTDMLHEFFRSAAVGQSSKSSRYPKIACPVKMAQPNQPAARLCLKLPSKKEMQPGGPTCMASCLHWSFVIKDTCGFVDFVEGLLNDWTPASAVRFFGEDDPIVQALQFCILPDEDGLKRVAPPASKPSSPLVWILVSDSSCDDPNDFDPAMFPAAPAAPPLATREGVAPKVKPPPPGLKITTPTVTLQSAPKAAPVPPEAVATAASASSRPAAKTSDQLPSAASLPSGYRRAYFMEDHLPEYEYTLMVNANAEASVVKESKDRLRRAISMGYTSMEDRYESDVAFGDRVHQEGRAVRDCIHDDLMGFANLPDPPRTRAQLTAGVAANAEHDHLFTKLVYFSRNGGVSAFPVEYRSTWTKIWGFMFGRQALVQ